MMSRKAQIWWDGALKLAGYGTIKEYQEDQYHKYCCDDDTMWKVPRSALVDLGKCVMVIDGLYDGEIEEQDMKRLVLFALLTIDCEKHHLNFAKFDAELDVQEIFNKYDV